MILCPPKKLRADGHGDQFRGVQVPPLPATVTKVAFSVFSKWQQKALGIPHD